MKIHLHLIIYCLTILTYSCKEKNIKYSYPIFNNEVTEKTKISGQFSNNGKEDGQWIFYNQNEDIIAQGFFELGFKKGTWTYLMDNQNYQSIDWDLFSHDSLNFKINHPKSWTLIPNRFDIFQATFPTDSKIKKTKYFSIASYSKDSIKMTLTDFITEAKTAVISNTNLKSIDQFELLADSIQIGYLMRFIYIRDSEEMLVYTFNIEKNGRIYDIGYSSLNQYMNLKNQLFNDMITSLSIGNDKIINPRKELKYKKIINNPPWHKS